MVHQAGKGCAQCKALQTRLMGGEASEMMTTPSGKDAVQVPAPSPASTQHPTVSLLRPSADGGKSGGSCEEDRAVHTNKSEGGFSRDADGGFCDQGHAHVCVRDGCEQLRCAWQRRGDAGRLAACSSPKHVNSKRITEGSTYCMDATTKVCNYEYLSTSVGETPNPDELPHLETQGLQSGCSEIISSSI